MDKQIQTVAFQLNVKTFEQLCTGAKEIGVSVDEVLRQAVVIWLSQKRTNNITESREIKTTKDEIISFEQADLNLIKSTLEKFNGNKSKAAEALGISTRTLYRRLEKWS